MDSSLRCTWYAADPCHCSDLTSEEPFGHTPTLIFVKKDEENILYDRYIMRRSFVAHSHGTDRNPMFRFGVCVECLFPPRAHWRVRNCIVPTCPECSDSSSRYLLMQPVRLVLVMTIRLLRDLPFDGMLPWNGACSTTIVLVASRIGGKKWGLGIGVVGGYAAVGALRHALTFTSFYLYMSAENAEPTLSYIKKHF